MQADRSGVVPIPGSSLAAGPCYVQPSLSGKRESGLLSGASDANDSAAAGVHEPLVALEERQVHAVRVAASHLLRDLSASVGE
eukprot:13266709-Alexandrium_andersonii.AAC.1